MAAIVYPQPIPKARLGNAKIVGEVSAALAGIPQGSVVAQVGVRYGDFSDVLLRLPNVAKVLAMDHFDLHSRGGGARLEGKPHQQFFESRFAQALKAKKLETRRGRREAIKALPNGSVNAFFLGGCREFPALMDELYMSESKLRPRGLISVSDYIMADYTTGQPYEVVRAVNAFLAAAEFEMAYLVLDHTMFCSVVLKRLR